MTLYYKKYLKGDEINVIEFIQRVFLPTGMSDAEVLVEIIETGVRVHCMNSEIEYIPI